MTAFLTLGPVGSFDKGNTGESLRERLYRLSMINISLGTGISRALLSFLTINTKLIKTHWDDILRFMATILLKRETNTNPISAIILSNVRTVVLLKGLTIKSK